jgi:polysaccharide biosynthesis transport protein
MSPESQAGGELVRPLAEPAAPAVQFARVVPIPRAGQAGLSEAPEDEISPTRFLRALRRRAASALVAAFLAAGVAGTAGWFLVPSSAYRSEARLHVASQPPKVLFQTVDNGGSDYSRFQNTQTTLVKSRLVFSAALRDPKVSGCAMVRQKVDPLRWLGDELKAEFIGGSEVMEISLTGNNPQELVCIVNAVKQSYMDEVVNVDARRRAARHEQLKKLRDSYTGLLKEKRETMRKLAETIGSDDRPTLALRQQYAMEHLHYLQSELQGVQSQKRRLEAQLSAMGRAEGGELEARPPISELAVDKLVEQHPAVAATANQLEVLEGRRAIELAKVRRTSRHPATEPLLKDLAKAVTAARQLLALRREEVRRELIRQARERGGVSADPEGQDVGHDLAMVNDLEHRLNEEINSISAANQSLTIHTLDLRGNQDEIAQMQATSDRIASEVEALNVEIQAPPRIRPIDDASASLTRDDKKRYMIIGAATLTSFLAGLFGVALLELQARMVDSADEISVELGLPIIGALPIMPAFRQYHGAIAPRENEKDRYWRNVLLESVEATRTLLQHAARTGSHQVMMITSAVSGEGKTSLASYLAGSLASSGLRTLLIDADLRRPIMHTFFDLPQAPGLSELLRGEVDLEDTLGATPVKNLTFLAAGRCDRDTLGILGQGGVAPLFDRLKQGFDFIIVDSSPVLPVADALQVAQYADAALFAIFRDVSCKTKVKAAFERLQRLGVPVLGAVMTGAHGGLYGGDHYRRDSSYPGLPQSVAALPNESS